MPKLWKVVRKAAEDFVQDDALSQGAALAFYTALSLAPLLVITLAVVGLVGEDAQERILDQAVRLLGPSSREAIQLVLRNVSEDPLEGAVSAFAGIVTLLLSATAVFVQLQRSMNRIWGVQARPGSGLRTWLRARMLSLGMIVVLILLLAASVLVSAAITYMFPQEAALWRILNLLVSLGVFTMIFAMVFRFLPDVRIAWKDTWLGAFVTAVLFSLGKLAIGRYLGLQGIGSAYGAAGSLVVLLAWVFGSALIVFFGAELTQAYSILQGRKIRPREHASWDRSSRKVPRWVRRRRGRRSDPAGAGPPSPVADEDR